MSGQLVVRDSHGGNSSALQIGTEHRNVGVITSLGPLAIPCVSLSELVVTKKRTYSPMVLFTPVMKQ